MNKDSYYESRARSPAETSRRGARPLPERDPRTPPRRSSRSADSTGRASRTSPSARGSPSARCITTSSRRTRCSPRSSRSGTEGLLTEIRPRARDPKEFRARLQARVARLLEYVEQHRAFFAIANEHGIFAGSAAPGARSAPRTLHQIETFRAEFRTIVEEGIASGALEPMDADALARFLGGTLRVFLLSSLADQATDVREQASTLVDLFLHGAARRRRRAR